MDYTRRGIEKCPGQTRWTIPCTIDFRVGGKYMSLFDYSIQELEAKLQAKEITVQDIVEASFKQIEEVDGDVQAFFTLREEQAREQAKIIENTSRRQKLLVMSEGIKDKIDTIVISYTCIR